MPSRWVIIAWANFALAVAAVLKFIPILVSLRHGLVLSPEFIPILVISSLRQTGSLRLIVTVR